MLVFEHVERFVFKVYIIGLDGCEIEYPPIVHSSQSSGPITGNNFILDNCYFC